MGGGSLNIETEPRRRDVAIATARDGEKSDELSPLFA
jgi:hypothetical protein